jgi:hypothetical protein
VGAEAGVYEGIALSRLPALQTADGLFRPSPGVEPVENRDGGGTALRAGAVVLLGLLRADEMGVPHPFSTGSLRTRVLGGLSGESSGAGELGIALWAESRADGGAVSEITGLITRQVSKRLERIPLEDLAWLVSGLTEASTRTGGGDEIARLLDRSEAELFDRMVPETGLAEDLHHRIGSGLTPAAGQFHALIALDQLVRARRGETASAHAQKLATALIALQRENGSWPGVVDPQRGEAAALYPVLTVTQVALAPIALGVAREQGLKGDFGAAISASLGWARGGNPLEFDLVHEDESRLDRGIVPRREPGAVARGISSAARRLRGGLTEPDPERLILDPDVSSEDLGWVLEAWAGR